MANATRLSIVVAVSAWLLGSTHAARAADTPRDITTWHIWTDATGEFTRTAALLEVRDGEVWLRQPSGRRSVIPWDQLSAADQQYALRLTEPAPQSAEPVAAEVIAAPQLAIREMASSPSALPDTAAAAVTPPEIPPAAQAGERIAATEHQTAPAEPEAASTARLWTHADGRMQALAELVEVRGDLLVFVRPNGHWATARLADLDLADQHYVHQFVALLPAAPEPAEMRQHEKNRPATLAQLVSGPLALLPTWEQQSTPARVIHLQVSRRYLEHFVNQDYYSVEGVSDYIAGAPVSGTSRLAGRSSIALVPSDKQAIADIFFVGDARASTVSYGGRAQISSLSTTNFKARKRLTLGQGGLQLFPATSNASSSASTCGICSSLPGLRGAIARRVTARRAEESQGQANYETARHFEAGLNRGMDRDVATSLAELDRFQKRFFEAAREGGLQLQGGASTTAERLDIAVFRRAPDAGEAAAPPAIAGDPPAAIWIHNSFLQQVLGNQPLREAIQPLVAGFIEPGQPAATRPDAPGASPSDWKVGWTQDGSWLTVSFELPGKPSPAHTAGPAGDRMAVR